MPNYTSKLKLEKPLENEYYNIGIFNSNSDKIDTKVTEIDKKIESLEGNLSSIELTAEGVTITDNENLLESNNVEEALKEIVKKANTNASSISNLQGSVNDLQNELGTSKSALESNINSIEEVI